MEHAAEPRIAALDLIRGLAVLGILAVNIAGFAGPPSATYSPHIPQPATMADEWAFAAMVWLFEGKMRALFSLLFGASMLLFVERAETQGRDGQSLQLRRLGWLALFGYLHFLLLWWGDILFLYAVAGCCALALRRLPAAGLLAGALGLFLFWQVSGAALSYGDVAVEHAALADRDDARAQALLDAVKTPYREQDAIDMAQAQAGWTEQVAQKLRDRPFYPLLVTLYAVGETLPYMLIGMVLYQTGFFAGAWPRALMQRVVGLGLGLGGTISLLVAIWMQAAHYPEMLMRLLVNYALALPHLGMALGYAAVLVLALPRIVNTKLARWLMDAGRMAFSNYIGTSVLMCGLFYGWGLGLFGQFGAMAQWGFVLLGWVAMLTFSQLWLAYLSQGPLEWVWRGLTQGRIPPLRRRATS